MTRDEMLAQLHNIQVGAELVLLPSEGALECQYVTSEGYGYEWIGSNDWPAYKINEITPNALAYIKEKLQHEDLDFDDIKDSTLYYFFQTCHPDEDDKESLNEFFSGLCEIEACQHNALFALYNHRDPCSSVEFYSNIDDCKAAFKKQYAHYSTPWDNLSDTELENWIKRLKGDFLEFPFTSFGFEYEDEESEVNP